jgi:predicted ribosome-associated RNA-binding protein Tma20
MGEFEKRLMPLSDMTTSDHILISRKELRGLLDAVEKEYPKVSQKWVPVKGRRVDWKILCLQMEQKIIAFENFGKKWFGEQK